MVHLQYELNSTKVTQAMVHIQYELNSTKFNLPKQWYIYNMN